MMPKEKDFIEKTLEEMNEIERLKYETAVELGLFEMCIRDSICILALAIKFNFIDTVYFWKLFVDFI